MQFKALLIGFAVFVGAIVMGIIASEHLYLGELPKTDSVTVKEAPAPVITFDGNGTGSGRGPGRSEANRSEDVPAAAPCEGTCKMKILSKPRPGYTDTARQNNVQGSVTLRITFLASGEIGSISPVSSLPDGLTEQAIAAARKIRFQPATRDGVPYTTSATVQYGFTIY